jgi:hypothetical protein
MLAASLPVVSGTGHIHGKLRKLAGPNEFKILLDAPFHSPEDSDPLSLKSHQGAAPYSSYNHSIHRTTGKGFHGLALTVSMVGIGIADGLAFPACAVKNHKRRG